jgi:hypothetical protein
MPSALKALATVLLPLPIPPVRPIIRGVLAGLSVGPLTGAFLKEASTTENYSGRKKENVYRLNIAK